MMQDNEMMMDSGPMGWMMGGMGIGAVLVLAGFHVLARGEAAAGQVLLVRLACTVSVALSHLVLYAYGRNGVSGC